MFTLILEQLSEFVNVYCYLFTMIKETVIIIDPALVEDIFLSISSHCFFSKKSSSRFY